MSVYQAIIKAISDCRGAGLSDEATAAIVMAAIQDAEPASRFRYSRALVADMPGVVVAKVPPADVAPDEEYGLTEFREGRRVGYNAAISAIITAGSATDV